MIWGGTAGSFENFGDAGEAPGVTADTTADFAVGLGFAALLCKLGFQEFEGKWGGVKEGTGRAPDSVGSGSARTETTGTREALP